MRNVYYSKMPEKISLYMAKETMTNVNLDIFRSSRVKVQYFLTLQASSNTQCVKEVEK